MYTMNKFRTIGRLKRAREAGGDPVPWFAWDNAVLGTLPYYLWFYRKVGWPRGVRNVCPCSLILVCIMRVVWWGVIAHSVLA